MENPRDYISDSSIAVEEHNGFKFNSYNVCLNPEKVEIIHTKQHQLRIEVAESQFGWVAGYVYTSISDGYASAPASHSRKDWIFRTKKEAIKFELRRLAAKNKKFADEIKEYLTPKTISLF